MIKKELGKMFKQARKEQKLRQTDLQDLCGVSASVLYKIENGRTDIALSSLLSVAGALGIKLSIKSPLGEEIQLHE